MANISFASKPLFTSLLMSFLLLHLVGAHEMVTSIDEGAVVQSPKIQYIDCGAACGVRCELSSRPHLCKRACGTCCARCNCVPPGTSGNYETCPCYANMTTHNGRPKCP